MSNSRLFCFGLFVSIGTNEAFRMLGYEGAYTGLDGKIAALINAAVWGAMAVAFWGDRTLISTKGE